MKINIKPKPFGILIIGIVIVFIGALAKINKESFASILLLTGLVVELIGVIIFFKWYFKMRKVEKNKNLA